MSEESLLWILIVISAAELAVLLYLSHLQALASARADMRNNAFHDDLQRQREEGKLLSMETAKLADSLRGALLEISKFSELMREAIHDLEFCVKEHRREFTEATEKVRNSIDKIGSRLSSIEAELQKNADINRKSLVEIRNMNSDNSQ
ncbi:MAG: hypothetical protein KatS3mg109_0039 [Pirellulaceae bacterium]|nr:MAG: hypothetical protein KatS3mg109_0039 [Pirellulaceae bacterium]